ncbi:MAG: nitrite/sulfite reductase, partial [Deltaproteobacteria bacterium]
VDQNFIIRWVSLSDLENLRRDLMQAGLGEPGAGTIVDITSCPGTDTCKLGISSSRGLAAELRTQLAEKNYQWNEAIQNLHIKISGCFNSCGQHHVADLGFYGVSRKMAGYAVPHFQVVLGGDGENNAGSYGLPVLAVPSKNIPQVVMRLVGHYMEAREAGEKFGAFIKRIGRSKVKSLLDDLTRPPAEPGDRSFFRDWNDPREYSLGDLGAGECAGEVVSSVEFGLAAAERQVFEAQLGLDGGDFALAWRTAYRAMLQAARSLVQTELPGIPEDPDQIVQEFRARFHESGRFNDPFAGGKFAHYFFAAHRKAGEPPTAEKARLLIEEAHLFVEASHNCYNRLGTPVNV